ncbi:taste receptor type 2 member 19-like [Perognathus longimembris pacificus]|uniref:taste receptor type 2 member 19-like n=1 Tax=Perognathus longimembris pacificus TaxID=214514 RepID=UPI00201905FD|nr:taste receptor type 2 member 19-like [Perognathus longimembris pacificus]
MTTFLRVMFSIGVAEFVLGNFANAFIALVNFIDWVQRRRITSADAILTALAVSRISLLWVIMVYEFVIRFGPTLYRGKTRLVFGIAWAITNHFSSWTATLLIIFYFLKIANFSNLTFLHLRRRVTRVMVLVLLGTSVFLCADIALLHVCGEMRMEGCEGNATWNKEVRDTLKLSTSALVMLMAFIPFVTSLVCVLLLIYSLCRHLKRMECHTDRSRDGSTSVHVKALCTMISFLLLFTMNSLLIIAASWRSYMPLDAWIQLLLQTFALFYPSSHSYVLIWGNRKLKQAFLLVLGQVRLWLRDWKPFRL